MKIAISNGILTVRQINSNFNKAYTKIFPDTAVGMRDAISWAYGICLGWENEQDEEWKRTIVA